MLKVIKDLTTLKFQYRCVLTPKKPTYLGIENSICVCAEKGIPRKHHISKNGTIVFTSAQFIIWEQLHKAIREGANKIVLHGSFTEAVELFSMAHFESQLHGRGHTFVFFRRRTKIFYITQQPIKGTWIIVCTIIPKIQKEMTLRLMP